MNEIAPQLLRHVLNNLPALLIRDALLDLFTETEKNTAKLTDAGTAVPDALCWIYSGKLLNIQGELYSIQGVTGIVRGDGVTPVTVTPLNIADTARLCYRNSPITLNPGDVANYHGDTELPTTVGRLLLNHVILVAPFGDIVPYINEPWNIGRIEETYLFEALCNGRISVEQVKHYSRNLHWLGHFTELCVPSFTERALTVDPKIIERRDQLLREHHDDIAAGDAVVMSKIEGELVAMDKAAMKGDESTLFYDVDSKSYDVHRKMMLITGGMVPDISGRGYHFIGGSLEEGWDVHNFPVICNEVRRGAYSSAIKTAEGGTETKFIIRVFQNTQIIADDCGSTNYLSVKLTKDVAKSYLYRNILVDGQLITLDPDNIATYINQIVQMRSPLHCHTPGGFCYTCVGELFRSIGQEQFTMTGVAVTSSFTRAALKAKHFTKARSVEITSLNQFVV